MDWFIFLDLDEISEKKKSYIYINYALLFVLLGDFVLLWKREKNRILFAGDLRIIRDDRIRTDGTSLQISSVLPKDSGEYECQISTNPPIELTHTLDVMCKYSSSSKLIS